MVGTSQLRTRMECHIGIKMTSQTCFYIFLFSILTTSCTHGLARRPQRLAISSSVLRIPVNVHPALRQIQAGPISVIALDVDREWCWQLHKGYKSRCDNKARSRFSHTHYKRLMNIELALVQRTSSLFIRSYRSIIMGW